MNAYHYLIDKKLIEILMPLVARTKFADTYLEIILKS